MAAHDAAAVGAALGLTDEHGPWLAALAALGPPPGGARAAARRGRPALLARLAVPPEDARVILAHRPSPATAPALWWLLERCAHLLARRLGGVERLAPGRRSPALGLAGRCFYVFVFLAALPGVRLPLGARRPGRRLVSDAGRPRPPRGAPPPHPRHGRPRHPDLADPPLPRRALRPGAAPVRARAGPPRRRGAHGRRGAVPARGPGPRRPHPRGRAAPPGRLRRIARTGAPFFARHFPDEPYRVATCTSWLLDDQLAASLPPTSNIVRFQRRFHPLPAWTGRATPRSCSSSSGESGHRWDALPRGTALERAVVDHLAPATTGAAAPAGSPALSQAACYAAAAGDA